MVDRQGAERALSRIADPKGNGSVLDTGRATGLTTRSDGGVGLVLSIDGLAADVAEALRTAIERALRSAAGATDVRIITTAERGAAPGATAVAERAIRRIVAVASGKGGVGKSTVAVNVAVALARRGLSVGLLDADIYGPSVPTLLGAHTRAGLVDNRLQPIEAHGVKTLSMGMMTDPDKAIVWRGPMAASAMTQMVEQTDWGMLDVLVIDLPPGTGDIQLTMAQKLKVDGAIVVSTPQDLALIDARRAIAMFDKVNVPVIGIVENMSLFICPTCGSESHIFGHGGARDTSAALGVPFLGAIPLHMHIREASDTGVPLAAQESDQGQMFHIIAEQAAAALKI